MIDFKNMNNQILDNLAKRGYVLPINYFKLKDEFKNIKITLLAFTGIFSCLFVLYQCILFKL